MKRVLLHTTFWSLFSAFIFYTQTRYFEGLSTSAYFVFQTALIATAVIIFYVNYLVITPKFMIQKRRIPLFLLSSIGLIVFGTGLSACVIALFHWMVGPPIPPYRFSESGPNGLSVALIFVVLSTIIRSLRQYNEERHKRAELKKIASDSELAAMKAQLNPHFLYNSFNTIYALAESRSELTSKAVLQLSDIMRYVTYSSGQTKVQLAEELTFINNYIAFQKLRVSEPEKKVTTNIEAPQTDYEISPLLFIPLVENAFKYCNLISETAKIEIEFKPFREGFRLVVSNEMKKQQNHKKGIGLITLRKMLALSYPEQHELKIWTEGDIHFASLYLNLSSNA